MNTHKDIREFLSGLSSSERSFLLLELMTKNTSPYVGSRRVYPGELMRLERWLLNSIDTVTSPRIRNSRMRLWFIFMLLRYGGLRLEEIFDLQADNLDLVNRQIFVRHGAHARTVPIPPHVARLLGAKIEEWPALFALARPFLCDSSLIRRSFAQYSIQCGISPRLLSARSLRKHRALELEYAGLPPSLVNLFLGRLVDDTHFDSRQAHKILFQAIDNEQFPKTSARNSFFGPLVSLVKHGILVETALESTSGLLIKAVITETSCQNLKLVLGMTVRALVKAPWVKVVVGKEKNPESGCNRFYGKIKEIKQDAEAMEIMVTLPEGNVVCALYAAREKPAFPVAVGDSVGVEFSPLSVILTAI